MNLIDGLMRGRSGTADAPAAARPAATDGVASNSEKGAGFDNILAEVSKRDGSVEQPAASLSRSDASASIRAAFSVSIAVASHGDSASSGAAGKGYAAANAGIGDGGAANSRAGIPAAAAGAISANADGGDPRGLAPVSPSQTPQPHAVISLTAAGGAAMTTKTRVETDISSASANSAISLANAGPANEGIQAARNSGMPAFFGGAAADAPEPASPGPAGIGLSPSLSSRLSNSGASTREGVARTRQGAQTRSGGATAGPSGTAPQALAQSSSTTIVAGAALLSATAPTEPSASESSASSASAAMMAPPTPGVAPARGRDFALAQGLNQGSNRSATSAGGAASISWTDAAPVPVSPPNAMREQGETKVTVVDRQMHFPPLAPSSPIDQIVNRIVAGASPGLAPVTAEAGSVDASSVGPSSGLMGIGPQSPLSATQVLHLQLEPEGLGAVSIRMRLSGDRLDLEVEAAHADTTRRIADDSDLLVAKLRSAGYATDHVVVRVAEPQPAQAI